MGTLEQALPLSLVNRDQFLALFYDPVDFPLQTKTTLHLHILRVIDGDFALGCFYDTLANSSLSYVLSRKNLEKFTKGQAMAWARSVQSKFKKPDSKAGEGGEVLLYSFLEGHLGAPKILSKMELKTSREHYVYGADGVHLLQSEKDENEYQLIFGESKMYAKANQAIKAAFKSMVKIKENDFALDTWLVESELLKESLDTDKVAVLESILLPSARGEDPIKRSNAFGVFIGYEIDGTSLKLEDMYTDKIEISLRQIAKDVIEAQLETIKSEISTHGLGAHHFHIYAVPFLCKIVNGKKQGIDNVRFDLAAVLGNNKGLDT